MEPPSWTSEHVDMEHPSIARVYDYYLGGSRITCTQSLGAGPGTHRGLKFVPSSRSTPGASGRPRLQDGPELSPKVVGHQLRKYHATSVAVHLVCLVILVRAPCVHVPTRTTGNHWFWWTKAH